MDHIHSGSSDYGLSAGLRKLPIIAGHRIRAGLDRRDGIRVVFQMRDLPAARDHCLGIPFQMSDASSPDGPPITPDGRYIVVRGRLWRAANPNLDPARRADLVAALMQARRDVASARRASNRPAEDVAHAAVQTAKVALGERGPVWWDDGAPDLNRHMARTTPYADWFAGQAD